MKKTLITLLLLGCSVFGFGQNFPCVYWPAPCPNSSAISAAEEWPVRIGNGALEQGLAFQRKVRNQLTDLLQKTAKQHGWQVYQVTDEYYDGPPFQFISFAKWEAASYEKRPPVWDDLAFVIIVNRDSLSQWRIWYQNFLTNAEKGTDQYAAEVKKAGDDPLLKAYFDSANYYTTLRTKYTKDHEQQYLQDLKNNNKPALQEHDKIENFYLNKADDFLKKYQDRQTEVYSVANQSVENIQNEQAKYTNAFTESTTVLIHFGINPYHVTTGIQDGEQHSLVPQYSFKLPGAAYAGFFINKKFPDEHAYGFTYKGYLFNNPASIATILFGNYQPKDSYNNYKPTFEKTYTSSAATLGTVKNIKCDVLQNLAVHIEGRPDKVNLLIENIDWEKISSMITR